MSTLLWRPALLVGCLVLGLTGCRAEPPAAEVEPTAASSRTVQPQAAPKPSPRVALPFTATRYHGWLNRIPHRLPLTAGLPPFADRAHDRVSLRACGDDVFGHRGESIDDRFVAAYGPEDDERRGVLLFADDRAAASYLRRSLARAQSCPIEKRHDTTLTMQVRRGHLGPRSTASFLVVLTASDGGRPAAVADWWEAARFGNAVLVTSVGGQASPDDVGGAIRRSHHQLQRLVDSMCAFTPEGCPVADPDVSLAFPLAAGYPADQDAEGPGYGLEGPSRALLLGELELCGRHSDLPRPTDELGASWTNVEDFRDRHLLTFPDATAASDWIGRLRAFWTACPREPTGDHFVGLQTLRRTAVGGESWALVRHFRYRGAPGIGLVVIQVVRLGRAVLVDQVSDEGGAGPELAAEVSGVLIGMTKASSRVVAAMCVYTEARCPKSR